MTTNTDDTTDFISRMSGDMVQKLVDTYKIQQGNRPKLFEYIHMHNITLDDIKFTLKGNLKCVESIVGHKLTKEVQKSSDVVVPDDLSVVYAVRCRGFPTVSFESDDCPYINFQQAKLEYINSLFSDYKYEITNAVMLFQIIYNGLHNLEIADLKSVEVNKLQVLFNATIIQDGKEFEFIKEEEFFNDLGILARFADKFEIDYKDFRRPKLDDHIVKVDYRLTRKNKIIYTVTWDTNCQTKFHVLNFNPSRLAAFYQQFGCKNEQELKNYAIELRAREEEMIATEAEVQKKQVVPNVVNKPDIENRNVQIEAKSFLNPPKPLPQLPAKLSTVEPPMTPRLLNAKSALNGTVKPVCPAKTKTKEMSKSSPNVSNEPKPFTSQSIPALLRPALLKSTKLTPLKPKTPPKAAQKSKPTSPNFSNFKTNFDNLNDEIIDLCSPVTSKMNYSSHNNSFMDFTRNLPFPQVADEDQMELVLEEEDTTEDIKMDVRMEEAVDIGSPVSPISTATISPITPPLDNKLPPVSSLLSTGVTSPPVMSNSTSSASLTPMTNLYLTISFSVCSLPQPSFTTTLPVNLELFDALNMPNKIHLTHFCPLAKLHKLEFLDFLPIPNIKEDCLSYINNKDAFIALINDKIVALSTNKDKECGFLIFKGELKLQDPWKYSTFINDTCDLAQPDIWQIEYYSKTVFSNIFKYLLGNLQMHELAWTDVVVCGNSGELQILRKYVTALIAHCSRLVEKKETKKLLIIEKDFNFQHLVTNARLDIHAFDTLALLEISDAKNGFYLTNSEPFLFIHSSVSVDVDKYKIATPKPLEHPKLTLEYCGIYSYCLKNYAKCAFIVTSEDSELFKFPYFKRIKVDEIPLKFVK